MNLLKVIWFVLLAGSVVEIAEVWRGSFNEPQWFLYSMVIVSLVMLTYVAVQDERNKR